MGWLGGGLATTKAQALSKVMVLLKRMVAIIADDATSGDSCWILHVTADRILIVM
jgi:polysaccharide deacetylase 2 family uncharacterized protein YibQ